jgi:ribonuclease P protein component
VPPRAAPQGRLRTSSRIRKRREYRQIQNEGARAVLAHFVLIFSAREAVEGALPRLGITASRKIGGAVQRNRAKRLIREAFRATRALFPPDIDLVVIVKTELGPIGLADVIDEWEAARPLIARRIEAARRGRGSRTAAT